MKLLKAAAAAAIALTWALGASPSAEAQAADYPSRPITIIVPYPAGGGNDTIARLIGQHLSTRLGQPVVVENRPGAAGSIGTAHVARSEPDGYTLLSASQSHGLSQEVFNEVPFDARTDFAPIIKVGESTSLLLVHPDRPYQSLEELVEFAKANPRKVTLATTGVASPADFFVRLLQAQGIEIVPVPYSGSTPALTDTLGGQVDTIIDPMSTSIAMAQSERLKLLAVTTADRIARLPDIPSVSEVGVNMDVIGWFGLFAPAGTPQEIVARLNSEIAEIIEVPEVRERFEQIAVTPVGGSPEELGAFVESELNKWAALMQEVGLEKQ